MKDIQWKYENNKFVNGEFLKAQVAAEDCPMGVDLYIATVPEGAIIKGITAKLVGQADLDATIDVVLDIGVNSCVLCASPGALTLGSKVAACVTDCACQIADQDYLVRVNFQSQLEVGAAEFFIEMIVPDHQTGCESRAIVPCTETVMIEPCTVACAPCGDGCVGNDPALKVMTWATTETFPADGPVEFMVSTENVGDTTLNLVETVITLDSALIAQSSSADVGTTADTVTTATHTIGTLAPGAKATMTYGGTGALVSIEGTTATPTATETFELIESDLTDIAEVE